MNITPKQMDKMALLKIDLERAEEANPTRQALMNLWDNQCRDLCTADPENEKYLINNIDSWTERWKARIDAGYPDSLEDGQILEKGINEAGALSSWIAAGTSYSNHGILTLPFYIFYSMFGFQRVRTPSTTLPYFLAKFSVI